MSSNFSPDDAAAAELWTEVSWLRGVALRHGVAGGEADDVVQETLLSAVARGDEGRGKDGERGRGWLRRVLERKIGAERRSEVRRHRRERMAARPEAELSDPAAAMEHMEFTRRLHGAVRALPRKDREVLALRFGAGLQPIEIAETLGTTPNAVSTRLSRALVKLRHRLGPDESRRGERLGGVAAAKAASEEQSHSLLLIPRTLPKTVAFAPALSLIVMKKKLGLAALAVALLVGAVTLLPTGGKGTGGTPSAIGAGPGASLDPIGEDEEVVVAAAAGASIEAPPPSPQRASIAAGEPAEEIGVPKAAPGIEIQVGSIAVEVHEAISGKPAVGVGLRLFRLEPQMRWYAFEAKATDASGVASFLDVRPGRYIIYMERVTVEADNAANRLEVAGGSETRASFLVDESQYAKGIVVGESGTPVPGASIWVGSGGGPVDHGVISTKSGPDGRFVAKYVNELQYLSASAPGYAPSLSAAKGVGQPTNADGEVVLTLSRRRGSLRGLVMGPSRTPLRGARLMLGSSQNHVDVEGAARGSYWTQPARHARSGDDGTFEFNDVRVGEAVLRARAPGTTAWSDVVTVVNGAAREVTVKLLEGGSVTGQITDKLGAPVGAAHVEWVGPGSGGPMTRTRAAVDEEGRFHLKHLLPGSTQLEARGENDEGVQTQTIEVRDGETHVWNPVLEPEGRFQGTLVSAAGEPLGNWHIGTTRFEGGVARGSGRGTRTDPDGLFSFSPGLGDQYVVSVYPAGRFYGEPALRLSPLAPTGEAIELVVPLAKIPRGVLRGRFQDGAGRPPEGTVELIVRTAPETRLEQPAAADGSFEFQHVPPGEFILTLRSKGASAHTWGDREPLGAGEVRHLGDLTTGAPK